MNFKYFFITLAILAFLSSFIPREEKITEGIQAPSIELTESKTELGKNNKYTLLNFWSPKDPISRISNLQISKILSDQTISNVDFISICIDADDVLASEVLKYDGTDSIGLHLTYSQISERVFKDYNVADKSNTFLIDPSGKILKVGEDVIKVLPRL